MTYLAKEKVGSTSIILFNVYFVSFHFISLFLLSHPVESWVEERPLARERHRCAFWSENWSGCEGDVRRVGLWLGDEGPGAAAKVWQRLSQGMTGRAGCRGQREDTHARQGSRSWRACHIDLWNPGAWYSRWPVQLVDEWMDWLNMEMGDRGAG